MNHVCSSFNYQRCSEVRPLWSRRLTRCLWLVFWFPWQPPACWSPTPGPVPSPGLPWPTLRVHKGKCNPSSRHW
jgi:hypothetical protein